MGASGEERTGCKVAQLLRHQFDPVLFDQVRLGQSNDASFHSQQIQNSEVFVRLRHRAIVRCHDKDREVDDADARHHIFHETFVSGHVDEGDVVLPVGEPDVDRDTPCLLLRQGVGVNPRQRTHQRRLTVIDVPCRPDDYVAHEDLQS